MNTIAAVLIVKNEAKCLKKCLDSVKDFVDEIVILDSGSSDDTESIARQYTDKFYTNKEWPGFGLQRQKAESYVESDFVLWLDADEVVSDKLAKSIVASVNEHSDSTVYQLNRKNSAYGKVIHHSGWSPDWIVRLYKRGEAKYNSALVHEKVIYSGPSKHLDGYLFHETYDDLHHHIQKSTYYIKLWADEREGKKKSGILTSLVHAFWAFFRMYFIHRGFLDGKHGFIIAWVAMHSTFVKYIDLYLREYKNDKS
ncbi:glycosyltransferase family 2 protein [Vibrio cholerae]